MSGYNNGPPHPTMNAQKYGDGQYYQQQQPPENYNTAGGYYPDPNAPPPQQYQAPYPEKSSYVNTENQPKSKWNDLFFAFLFLAQFCAFIAVSVISINAYTISSYNVGGGIGDSNGSATTLNRNTAYLLALIAAAGFLFSVIFLGIIRAFTKIVLEICLLLSVVFSVAYAIYLWIRMYWSGAVIFTIFAILSIIMYFPMRKRIPFTTIMLQTVLRVCDMYKSTYAVAISFTVLQAVYSVWWSFTLAASYQKWAPGGGATAAGGGSSGSGAIACVAIFLVFSYYWTTQFITNLCLTTEAGIFGTWYFTGGKEAGANKPTKVARGALRRACTYSFGSIAFGSLIVALLDLLRAVLRALYDQAASGGDIIGMICACVAQCCVGCIAWMVEFFNRYAYIEIALYGKAYIAAAKDAWHLIKNRGIEALINDCLVNNIATIFSYVSGALCSGFAYLYLRIFQPDYVENTTSLTAVILFYAFIIGFMISYSLLHGAIAAGVSTLFVGLAENPEALSYRAPDLFEHIRRTYPNVVNPV